MGKRSSDSMNQSVLLSASLLTIAVGLFGCVSIPDNAKAVKPFDVKQFSGKWYEVARFDYRFEKDLVNVTAEYGMRPDGMISVLNRGYNTKKEKWQQVEGQVRRR